VVEAEADIVVLVVLVVLGLRIINGMDQCILMFLVYQALHQQDQVAVEADIQTPTAVLVHFTGVVVEAILAPVLPVLAHKVS
jgi:hypothetical protein